MAEGDAKISQEKVRDCPCQSCVDFSVFLADRDVSLSFKRLDFDRILLTG